MCSAILTGSSTSALLCAVLAASGCGCSGPSQPVASPAPPPAAPQAAPQAAQPEQPPVDERQKLRDELMTTRLEDAIFNLYREDRSVRISAVRITWTKTVNEDERHGQVTFTSPAVIEPKEVVLMMGGHNHFYFADQPRRTFKFNTDN